MPYSESQKRATRKYIAKNYDRLELQLKKGMKEVYRAQAAAHGLSLNAYIIGLLEADADTPAPPPGPTAPGPTTAPGDGAETVD